MKPILFLSLFVCTGLLIGCQTPDPVRNTTAKLKPVVDAYYYAWNTGKLDTLNAICDPQVVSYSGMNSAATGLDSLKRLITGGRAMYPDLKLSIEEELYVGEHAMVRYTMTGTPSPRVMFPSFGKSFKVSGLSLLRFVNGKLVEEHSEVNYLDFQLQLGFKLSPPTK